jgi:predicted ATPase
MSASSSRIRTPDQRLRVFVSSTLRELAPERAAVRAAIDRLAMAPVMFELGARPHPPRDLYRAYLAQSDIFVGVYGDSYGWVAPGEEVSGLEDEYLLTPSWMPRLIYVRASQHRQERLDGLLQRIRDDDRAAYKAFSTPEELRELVTADLATLLAERFDESSGSRTDAPAVAPAPAEAPPAAGLPVATTRILGRERELADVVALLTHDGERLVTLLGPGGIGKTRLALAVAEQARQAFPDGALFVDLAPFQDPSQVLPAVAQALGIRDAGDGTLEEKVRTALRGRRTLLLLDNLEQVVDAANVVRDLVSAVPTLSVLATSRILLRVSGERTVEVGPLPLPDEQQQTTAQAALDVPSVALFVERARAVKPDFELTDANVSAVSRICEALDGVPLAIELAAARLRILPPQALLDRLSHGLPLLTGGSRDLPVRQRTLRSTIEWSTRLLAPPEQELLARLGVFAGGFTLEAAEWIADGIDADALDALGALVDGSLVRQREEDDRAVFSMLATVREYALEELDARGALADVKDRHARFYLRLAAQAEGELEGAAQRGWVQRLTEDRENVAAAERFLLDERRFDEAADLAWDLYVYWWVGGSLPSVRAWMQEALDTGGDLAPHTRAVALYFTRAISFWQDADDFLVPGLRESAALFGETGDASGRALALVSLALALLAGREPDPAGADAALEEALGLFREARDGWGEAFALITLGRVDLLTQHVDRSLERFEESLVVSGRQHDALSRSIGLHHRGWAELLLGRLDAAEQDFEDSLAESQGMGHDEGIAYGLEGLVATSAARGDVQRAGRLLGASEVVREQKGLYNALSFTFHRPAVEAILAGPGAAAFESSRAAGRELGTSNAVRIALADRDGAQQPVVGTGATR